MTDLSDLDIARLRKDAKELSQITHSGRPDLSCGKGCKYLYYHQSCAILALIERLEKAEKDALTWQDLAIKWRATHGQTEYQRNKYGLALTMIEKGCADPAQFAGDILRSHPLTEKKTDE